MSDPYYGQATCHLLLVALLSVLLVGVPSTDADVHRHRRDSSSDLSNSLSHEASKVAEGTKTSLPQKESVTHPPNSLGISLDTESDISAKDNQSRTELDYDAPLIEPVHHRHRGHSSRSALVEDIIPHNPNFLNQMASSTRGPSPETQLFPPITAVPTPTMSSMEKLFSTLKPHRGLEKEFESDKKVRRNRRKSRRPSGRSSKQVNAINELSKIGKNLKENAPSVIFINGRKFNQIEQTGCVEEKFYSLLMKDLAEIIPHKRLDTYETYYDYNYAKAVAAVLEAPKVDDTNMIYREDQGELLLNGLEELQKYWNITMTVYRDMKQKRHSSIRTEVAMHRWLYERLEGLKALLIKGEESLVALNNRVRKLNKAPRERDLQRALCSCITSRSGKTVIGIMNELFVDKNTEKRLNDLEYARKQGLAMADDTASYCAYWYGDTIRTQANMKEKHIQGMVRTLSHNRSIMSKLQKHYKVNRTIITTTSVTSNLGGSQVTEVKTRIVTRLIDMTDLWLPKLADWIRSKLNIEGPTNDSSIEKSLSTISSTTKTPSTSTSTSPTPTSGTTKRAGSEQIRKRRSIANSSSTQNIEPSAAIHPDEPSGSVRAASTEWMNATSTKKPKPKKIKESQFEAEISEYGEKCAKKGFSVLLSVAYDQSTLMYNSDKISLQHKYIRELEKSFSSSFKRLWRKKRNHWSQKMSQTNATEMAGNKTSQPDQRTVDEEMSDSFEAVGSSYERGMRLGYMVGRFVGEKAARQWPDPAELNTFTYDSLFLAGLASGYNETATRQLEQKIVTETTKRIAFTEASRQVFAKTLVSSYQNGASLVPIWGVLHGQRAVAKQAAKEGAKVGHDASLKAASEFGPKAHKFFLAHKMQRALSSPYKLGTSAIKLNSGKFSSPNEQMAPLAATTASEPMGVRREIDQVQLEIEVHRSVSREATKCGKQTGLVMGALMGLVVTPEAFESYTRFRGSLEGLENEFNHFKLGALRGYQFGENAAYLNYTAMLNQNLAELKNETGTEVARSKDAANKKAAKAREMSGNSQSPFPDDQEDDGLAHTDNVFQFMIVNYGPNLVANHSSKSMLKIRSQVPDDSVIQQIHLEAQDYLAANSTSRKKTSKLSNKNSSKKKKHKSSGKRSKTHHRISKNRADSNSTPKSMTTLKPSAIINATTIKPLHFSNMTDSESDELDTLFGRQKVIGEVSGFLVSNATNKKYPIKINILDIGPILELEENELEANDTSIKTDDIMNLKPLTDSLSKLEKVFIKLQAAHLDSESAKQHSDPLADFLNAAQLDNGEGYMCGTFSNQLLDKVANGTSHLRVRGAQVDDLSLEVSLLDELARRIEEPTRNYPKTSSVELVENVLGPTRGLQDQSKTKSQ